MISRYPTGYRPLIDEVALDRAIASNNPVDLEADNKRFRELQCDLLPGHLSNLRTTMDELKASIRDESTVAACTVTPCNIPAPAPVHCSKTHCEETGSKNGGWGPWEKTTTFCAREVVYIDETCKESSDHAIQSHAMLLKECIDSSPKMLAACMTTREAVIQKLRDDNSAVALRTAKLVEEETVVSEKLRLC